jgi:hypothetical protein
MSSFIGGVTVHIGRFVVHIILTTDLPCEDGPHDQISSENLNASQVQPSLYKIRDHVK